MKKIILMAAAIITATSVCAQHPDPFLTDETRPDGTLWILEPPSLTGGDFANDFYYYQWGKDYREGMLGYLALWMERSDLYLAFSNCLDIELSPERTPEILKLADAAVGDAHKANYAVKEYYKRKRPFATFNEPSLKPETDDKEALTYSYPSGHSSRGWMFALSLATVAPHCTALLMERAREYALFRVVCGHHWKSDIDASLMLTAGVFASVVATDEYQQQLAKAREEYRRVKAETSGVRPSKVETPAALKGPAYTTNGTPATENSRGVIIRDGQKTVVK